MRALITALVFLIQFIFNLYLSILLLRVILQWVGAHYYNPISQLVIKLTDPLIKPLRKIIPSIKGIDFASLILLVFLEFVKLVVLFILQAGVLPGILGLLIWAFADLLRLFINIYFFAIIIVVILRLLMAFRMIGIEHQTALLDILYLITEPLLQPVRRIIPIIAGWDFSPLIVLVVLQLIDMLCVNSLLNIGINLALGR